MSNLYANIKLNKTGKAFAYASFFLTLGCKCWIPKFGFDISIGGDK